MSGKVHAIVIGNEHYRSLPAVSFALEDARAFFRHVTQAELRPVDRELAVLWEDVGLSELGSKLRVAFQRVQRNDSVIMYCAGHGLCEDSRGFLLPVEYGPSLDNPELPPNPHTGAFAYDVISAEPRRAKPRHFVLILDSCHSGSAVNVTDLTRSGAAEHTRDLVLASARKAFGDDPCGPSCGKGRVVRGGSWSRVGDYCRSAYRGYSVFSATRFNLPA